MAHPLELAYNWRLPLTFASLGLSICLGVLLADRAPGWVVAAAFLVLLWAAFLALVWLRTRARLMVDGARAEVRSAFTVRVLDGRRVRAVRQRRTPHGPSYRLAVHGGDAGTRHVTVPTGLLRGGDQVLFAWLQAWAPDAVLDDGSQRSLDRLKNRGLVP